MVEALIAEQNTSSLKSKLNLNISFFGVATPNADLSNDRKNPWLIIVIPIRSDTEIDFLGEIIRLVSRCKLEDAIRNTLSTDGS